MVLTSEFIYSGVSGATLARCFKSPTQFTDLPYSSVACQASLAGCCPLTVRYRSRFRCGRQSAMACHNHGESLLEVRRAKDALMAENGRGTKMAQFVDVMAFVRGAHANAMKSSIHAP